MTSLIGKFIKCVAILLMLVYLLVMPFVMVRAIWNMLLAPTGVFVWSAFSIYGIILLITHVLVNYKLVTNNFQTKASERDYAQLGYVALAPLMNILMAYIISAWFA